VHEKQSPGHYEITFDGDKLAGGIYYYKIETITENGNTYTETKKLLLAK
jgi:hypothetical protein